MSRKSLSSLVILIVVLAFGLAPVLAQGDGGKFTFTGWSLQEGSTRDVIMGAVDAYSADTGAEIEPVAFPYNEYLNQVLLQARGSNITGLVQLDIAWLAPMAAMGVLKDLGPVASEVDYTDAALSSGQVNGVQYGLPWTTASIGMVANMGLLEEAGVTEIPTTIEEFEAALEALKAYDPDVIPYAAMTDTAQLKDIIPWIWTFGGTVIDDEGSVVLNDEGTIAAVEWYASLLDRGLIAADMDRFDARQLFAEGRVGFYEDAIVARALAAGTAPDSGIAENVVPVPRPVLNEGDAPQALLWGHILVVIDDENGDDAAAFAKYLTSDEDTVLNYFSQLALPPTTESALASDTVQSDEYVAQWSSGITATARTNPFWPYTEAAAMETAMNEQVQAVLTGSASAEDAMNEAHDEISDLID
ncbi:MAG TPA: extracellular solute-binding protein [Aggregatilinea sp.]|uniref:ABC transporter substrate-binding protein n=1 Tax=Aggregatilinea sp. TaxID=2806333 RepID=UPI002C5D0686|nr:extracellular solute-binding protein [Aggregatilinea sp.]HML21634.1 extracellular solute-binding protein [Aggregatilinea sp.]